MPQVFIGTSYFETLFNSFCYPETKQIWIENKNEKKTSLNICCFFTGSFAYTEIY